MIPLHRHRARERFVLGSPLVGPRFEKIAHKFRSEVEKAERIERATAKAEAKDDFDRVEALEAKLAAIDREHQKTWQQLSELRFTS